MEIVLLKEFVMGWSIWQHYPFVTLALVALLWFFFSQPLEWIQDLTNVGYRHLLRHGKCKAETVKNARRRRRIGNLPPVYPNGWFALMQSDELKCGETKHVAALGENFAVFRSESGHVHVLDAYCPHLGANMAIGGVVFGDCLECPFHGWQFRGSDGQCTEIPYSTSVPKFAKVNVWQSIEVNHTIFVWYHAEGEDPSWIPKDVPEIKANNLKPQGHSVFEINCHIQEIPENGGDVAHLNVVHAPALVGGSDLNECKKSWFSLLFKHAWSATWESNDDHTATMNLYHEVRLLNKFSFINMTVRAEQIGPGYVVMHIDSKFGSMVLLQTVTPVEPLVQKVEHRIFASPYVMPFSNFLIYAEARMFERDIMVWNHKTYLDRPLLVKEDKALLKHRRWYSQFYSANSPTYASVRDNLEW